MPFEVMSAMSPSAGTWLGFQLAAVFQLPPLVLVQAMVAARPEGIAVSRIAAARVRGRAPRKSRFISSFFVMVEWSDRADNGFIDLESASFYISKLSRPRNCQGKAGRPGSGTETCFASRPE